MKKLYVANIDENNNITAFRYGKDGNDSTQLFKRGIEGNCFLGRNVYFSNKAKNFFKIEKESLEELTREYLKGNFADGIDVPESFEQIFENKLGGRGWEDLIDMI